MSPSGYYLFLLDELDSDEKNIIELNNILKKLGIEFTLEDHKNSSEKKYRTLGIKIDFDTIEKFETRGAGKKKAIAKNNITVGELKELKKTKTNEGEVPQYYVENNHEAIIDPQIFELVQAEIAKRNKGKERYSGVSIFSTKVQCAECGGWYGSKVWHSNDKYRRIVYQCNN